MADKKIVTDTGLSTKDDDVIVSPDSVEQETEVRPVKKKSKGRMFLLLGTALIGGVLLFGVLSGGGNITTTNMAVPPAMNATSGGQALIENPAYLDELRASNDQMAEEARRTGRTFIPTSESILAPDDTTSEAIPDAVAPVIATGGEQEPVEIRKIAPAPTMPQLRREATAATAAQPQAAGSAQPQQGDGKPPENPYLANMGRYFTSIASARVPVASEAQGYSPAGDSASPATAGQRQSQSVSNSAASFDAAASGEAVTASGSTLDQPLYSSSSGTMPSASPADRASSAWDAQRAASAPRISATGGVFQAHEDGLVRDQTGRVVGIVNQDGTVSAEDGRRIGVVNRDGTVFMGDQPIEGVASTTESSSEEQIVHVPAGDVLYGQVVTNNSSDRPEVPVIAEITVGKYEGARVLGTFTTDDASGKMVISFSQMTFNDKTVPIKALAVDGFSGDSAVRSGIDKRYLKRYGPIFASAFLGGLAEGLAETQQTVVGIGDSQSVVSAKRSTEESIWSGISDATSAITSDISSRAPSGPNIKLGSGYPVGILFVDDLRENPEEDDR